MTRIREEEEDCTVTLLNICLSQQSSS